MCERMTGECVVWGCWEKGLSTWFSSPSSSLPPSSLHQVLIYNGQLDIVVGPPLTEAYLQVLPWSGAASYRTATKKVWKINPSDTEVAGYTRTVGNFTQVWISEQRGRKWGEGGSGPEEVRERRGYLAMMYACMQWLFLISVNFPSVQAVVRGAGHILPYDQPERGLDMIERFVSGKGF